MKILELTLKNFRCFEQETFEFSEDFNVLIGNNATGKTVILDALAISLGSFFLGIDGINPESISKNDIRRITKMEGETPTVETILPVEILSKGFFETEGQSQQLALFQFSFLKQNALWSRELKKDHGRTTRENAKDIEQYARELQEQSRTQEQDKKTVILPIISYYGTGRLWVPKLSRKQNTKIATLPKGSRFRGYENCLTNSHEIKKLAEWFKTWELSSLQQGKALNTLAGVKEAIKNCMEDWEDVRYDVLSDELVATSKNGKILPFRMLSDGVRNMIGMVADIAYRCVTLNPQFEVEAAKKTPGIVLIDEIELHLHPKWQRRVVEDLKRTFPEIQFIVTTHSPFIIQSLYKGKLINLNSSPSSEYKGRSIEDIIEDIMGIELPQYSRRKLAMLKAAEEYYQVLEEAVNIGESNSQYLEVLKKRLDELSLPFSDNPAYHAFLTMERMARGI